MFQTINGVQVKEHDATKLLPNILDKRFKIEYLDNVYLHKLVCLDFININVKGPGRLPFKQRKYGRLWMFVVKHNDYELNRHKYVEVGCINHDKIGEFLVDEYGYKPGKIIMDSMEGVYVI